MNGIHALLDDPRIDVMCIYIDVDDKIRLLRALNREEHPDCLKLCERFIEEDKIFSEFDFDYYVFNNNRQMNELSFPEVLKIINEFGQR